MSNSPQFFLTPYEEDTLQFSPDWTEYVGGSGASITNIQNGLRLTSGTGAGGYADHVQIWSKVTYPMPYGGQILFTITRRDNSVGIPAQAVMMLYFGTVGDGTAGHDVNPSLWPGATAATRWEYSSLGMRVSFGGVGGDPNIENQIRTREMLAAGDPDQGTQILGQGSPNFQPGIFVFDKDVTYNCNVTIDGNNFTFTQTRVSDGVVKVITQSDPSYAAHLAGYMGFRVMENLDFEMTNFSVVPADQPTPSADWVQYVGTDGAAITIITGGLHLKSGNGPGTADDYANHVQIWSTNSFSMPNGGTIAFSIKGTGDNVGIPAQSVMMLYWGTVGDGTTGHPANPSSWPGATSATRWEYSSFGMRMSFGGAGSDPLIYNQIRTREQLAAGSPNQGTAILGQGSPNQQPGIFDFAKNVLYDCLVTLAGNVFTFKQTKVSDGTSKTITHTDPAYSAHLVGYFGFRLMKNLEFEMTNFVATAADAGSNPPGEDLPTPVTTINVSAGASAAAGLANLQAAINALPDTSAGSPTVHTKLVVAAGTYGSLTDTLNVNVIGRAGGITMIEGASNYGTKLLCTVVMNGAYNVLTQLRVNGLSLTDQGDHNRVRRCRRYTFAGSDTNIYGIRLLDGSTFFRADYNEITVEKADPTWTSNNRRHAIYADCKSVNCAKYFSLDHNHIHRTPAKPGAYNTMYIHTIAIGNTANDSYFPCYGLLYKNVLDDIRGSDGVFEFKTSRLTIWKNTGRRWMDGIRGNGTPSHGYPSQRRGKENTWLSNYFEDTATWNIMGFGHIVAGNRTGTRSVEYLRMMSGDIPGGAYTLANYESANDCWVLSHTGKIDCGDSFSDPDAPPNQNQDFNPSNTRFDAPKTGGNLHFTSMNNARPSLFNQTRPAVGAPTAGVINLVDPTKQKAPGGGVPAFTDAVALVAPTLRVGGLVPTEQQYINQVTTVVAGSEGEVGPWAPYEDVPLFGAGVTVPA